MKSRNFGIALSYTYTIINTVCGLFMSAFILRSLGKTEYGLYQTMASFATYLTLFEFGTGTIMTRNVSLCKADAAGDKSLLQKNISTIWTITQILSLVMLVFSLVFYFLIDSIYKNSLTPQQISYGKILFIIVVVNLLISFSTQTINGTILGFENYSLTTTLSLIYLIVRTIIIIFLFMFIPKSIVLAITDTVLSLLILIFNFIYCKKTFGINFKFKYFDRKIFITILPLSLAMFLQVIVNQANGNVDKFVIGIAMSPEAVAVYSVAMYIYSVYASITTIPISMYMPQIAKSMKSGISNEQLTETLIQPCRLITMVGGAILFGFISIGRPFISIVYGSDYIEAWIITVIIMVPMFINMSNGILINVLDVLRKRHIRSFCLIITTVGNIIFTIWWIKIWGMVGAAIATAVFTLIGQVFLMNLYYSKAIHIKIMYLFKQSYKGILIWFILACVTSLIVCNQLTNNMLSFLIGGFIFVLISTGGILLFGLNDIEKQKLHSFIHKLKRS